ncbi:MAG: hypothetical protein GQ570_15520 [Helicobacteraceae bacterium]|nr:hypothetical protein [Helicobacteraceae bacterium]
MQFILRVLTLSFLFSVTSFAADLNDESMLTTIYTYGDVDFLRFLITAVSKGIATDGYQNLVYVTSFFAVIAIGWKVSQDGTTTSLLKNSLFPLMIIGFLNLTVTVHIEDQRITTNSSAGGATFATIDGIPSILAYMYGTASIFQYIGIGIVEDALVTLDPQADYSTSQLGFAKAATSLLEITDALTNGDMLKQDDSTARYAHHLKQYTRICVLQLAMDGDRTVFRKLIFPENDIIDTIEAVRLGLTDNNKINKDDGTEVTCQEYWSGYLSFPQESIANTLRNKLSKLVNLNLDTAYKGLTSIGAIDINSSQLTGELGSFNAYLTNTASMAAINTALAQQNMGVTSSLDAANAINAQKAMSEIQLSGLGIGRWFATIAPYVFHILQGVLYFYGLFIPAIAILLGYEAGSKYILSYFGGLVGMAAVGIGMALSSDITSYFAKQHMVELVSTLGGHQATIGSIRQYYVDLATYTGVIGFLGSMMALIAPSIILKGQASAAITAVGSLNGSYKGNPDSAESTIADEKASNKAYETEKEEIARDKLSKLDSLGDIPTNMKASDYYQKLTSGIASQSESWGNYNSGHRGTSSENEKFLGDIAKGSMYQQEQNMSKMAEFGSRLDAAGGGAVANNSGKIQGAIQASTVEADSLQVGKIESIADGTKNQAVKKLENTSAYGQGTTTNDAMRAGQSEGATAAAKDKTIASDNELLAHAKALGNDSALKQIAGSEGLIKSGAFNAEGEANKGDKEYAKYEQGLVNQSRIAANKTMGIGKLGELSSEDMSDIQRVGAQGVVSEIAKGDGFQKGKYKGDISKYKEDMSDIEKSKSDSTFGQAKGVRENYKKGVSYSDNAEHGETSKQQSTKAKLDVQGGVKGATAVDVADASVKAKMQQSALDGSLQQHLMSKEGGGHSKEAAEKMTDAILSGGKGAAEAMANALKSVGSQAFALSAGKTGADITSVETANKIYGDDGYVGLQKDSAKIQTEKTSGDTSGLLNTPKEHRANFINKALDHAALESNERYNDVKKAFNKAGLVNDKGEATPENWVSGTSYLKANNMNSHNALVAGGMLFSGAIGGDSTVQASAIDSVNTGSETKFNRQTKSLASMYNAGKDNENKLSLNENGDIDYKNSSKESLSGFGQFAANSNLAKNTKDNFLNDFVAKVADETSAPQEAVWATMGVVGVAGVNSMTGNPIKKAGRYIAEKSPFREDAREEKTDNTRNNNHSTQPDKTHNNQSSHVDTPKENLKYSKDQINQSREAINDYNQELKKEQGKPNPSQSRIADLESSIESENRNLDSNKKYYDENLDKSKKVSSKGGSNLGKGVAGTLAAMVVDGVTDGYDVNLSDNSVLSTVLSGVKAFGQGADTVQKVLTTEGTGIISAGSKALQGDFSGAASTLGTTFNSASNQLYGGFDNISNTISGSQGFSNVGDSLKSGWEWSTTSHGPAGGSGQVSIAPQVVSQQTASQEMAANSPMQAGMNATAINSAEVTPQTVQADKSTDSARDIEQRTIDSNTSKNAAMDAADQASILESILEQSIDNANNK